MIVGELEIKTYFYFLYITSILYSEILPTVNMNHTNMVNQFYEKYLINS